MGKFKLKWGNDLTYQYLKTSNGPNRATAWRLGQHTISLGASYLNYFYNCQNNISTNWTVINIQTQIGKQLDGWGNNTKHGWGNTLFHDSWGQHFYQYMLQEGNNFDVPIHQNTDWQPNQLLTFKGECHAYIVRPKWGHNLKVGATYYFMGQHIYQ